MRMKMNKIKHKKKIGRKKRQRSAMQTILKMVPCFYALGIMGMAFSIQADMFRKMFLDEERIRMLELALMGVVEIDKHNKKAITEYHYKEGIGQYIKNFLRRNKKWKVQKDEYTGKLTLIRVYRRYYKRDEEDRCHECGRVYDE